jgi:hypothetical protein
LTWHDEPGGYQMFFNRDERRERKPAIPPSVQRRGDTRFIAPLDGDFGGTWLAVNEFGLSVCLLNGFPAADLSALTNRHDYTSRGHLTLTIIENPSAHRAAATLRELDLERFRPFVLVALEPGDGGVLARWSGSSLELAGGRPPRQPIVSSSFFTEEVRRNRVAVFGQLQEQSGAPSSPALHLAYHRSHLPDRGPHSPCMHRPDASTVSFAHIHVTETAVCFDYVPGSPCLDLAHDPPTRLERRKASQ